MIRTLPLIVCCLAHLPAAAQTRGEPTQVMVLGVFHMNNPKRDLFNPTIKDVLGTRRHQEIQEVVTRLQRFRPTKIALESPPGSRALQERLDNYLAAKYTLTADERDQIGLRLAKNLGHIKVYGIDFKQDLDFDSVFHFAKENGQEQQVQHLFAEFNAKIKPKLEAGFMESHSVREILVEANAQKTLDMGHRIYVGLARISAGDKYPGADLVSRWYDRNLKIAINIARLADQGPQRILVIIGSGHAKLVRHFLSEMPDVDVMDCAKFLE
jgi:hypothetical protein